MDDRLSALSAEAMECRDLRHAWPYSQSPRYRWHIEETVGKRISLAWREMECERGCGTVAVDLFQFTADCRRIRVQPRRYRHLKPYLIKRSDADGNPLPPISAEEIGFAIMMRLFPAMMAKGKATLAA